MQSLTNRIAAQAILADANPPASYLLVRSAVFTELDVELELSAHGLDTRIVSATEVRAAHPYRSEGWERAERAFWFEGSEREQFEADECARIAELLLGWSVRLTDGAFVCTRRAL